MPIYEELIRKICPVEVQVIPRLGGSVPGFMDRFPKQLRVLEHIREGRPIDKALVIRDTGGKDTATVERLMADRIRGRSYAFPGGVQLITVRRTMETWLLADEEAVNSVALMRGGQQVSPMQGTLEEIVDPKETFRRWLSEAKLPYDAQVCREIVRQIKLETLRYRCPSFRSFEQKVLDC